MTDAPERDTTQVEQIRAKINKIVDEFAQGDISREQFTKIYEHYQSQLIMAMQISDGESLGGSPHETMALRSALTAKSKAMTLFYYPTRQFLETIGDFDISVDHIAQELDQISVAAQSGKKLLTGREQLDDQWVVYVSGRFSTVVVLFSNEPSARQITIVENMHRDFEVANEVALKSGHADGTTLVYPFQLFVRRSTIQRQ